ncbi:M50 family metallopeptidase [Modestobacter sp. VKM Ac-2978]|uniref:M50 family metallopeptidase n=1 Tax=Modestobacter sp. VKM Ac-2978 TaxID=3004132 RepID=UPI0022AAAA57|nr:site-2 protease family protein [Modestobacter sp. VKM Ac-2978]MCZ2850712.1 site-2 protease family protein [Modestobacter sp. VKM Ac-2978]
MGPGARPRRHRRGQPETELELSGFLLTVLGIVAFAVGLLFSIGFHEFGHFYWARKFGMRVPQFFVGFGTTVWSFRRGETEFGIKAIPLGGYIRIVGMIPPAEEGESKRATRMRSFIAEVRGAALNDVLPTDRGRVFYAKPWWQRVIVMFAGPFHNLVLAVLLFLVLLVGIGLPTTTTTIAAVPDCVLPAGAASAAAADPCTVPITPEGQVCEAGAADCALPPAGPAAQAGLQAGDTILAIDGEPVTQEPGDGWEALVETVQASASTPLTLTVAREDAQGVPEQLDLTVTPIENTVYTDPDSDGEPDGTEEVGYLGVQSATEYVGQPLSSLPGYFGTVVVESVQRLVQIPERIPQLFRATFMGEERDREGPIGLVGVSRLSGEAFALEQFSNVDKLSFFVSLLASVNLVLFLFNLVPLYPLDGGHVAGALYEKARSTVARLRGRPDPGPFDIARLMPVAYAVAGLFILLSGLLVIADVVNPITLQ